MKDQVLKLCRRLKNCTLDDILQLVEIEPTVLELILIYLIDENKLKEVNGVYSVVEKSMTQNKLEDKNLQLMYMYHSPETVDFIVRGFCVNIPTTKMSKLVDVGDNCIGDFYRIFRNLIYERQLNELLNYYFKSPQQGRFRTFFEKHVCFYIYNNNVYVIHKMLNGNNEKIFSKDEIQEFKKIYCYLSRIESHNINEVCLYQRLAEGIWRRNKSFEELYEDLKNNLIV